MGKEFVVMHIGKGMRRALQDQQIARSLPAKFFDEAWGTYIDLVVKPSEGIAASDMYHFRPFAPEDPVSQNGDGDADGYDEDVTDLFYSNSRRTINEFYAARDRLTELGNQMIGKKRKSADNYRDAAKQIVSAVGEQVKTFISFNDAKATPPIGYSQLDPIQKFKMTQIFTKIGAHKSEGIRESTRRNIPRFAWHPIDYPEGLVRDERDREVRRLWSGYTTRDASLLIHPDFLAEGKAPFHMAIKAAQKVEKDGDSDLGYHMRTSSILSLLSMERERTVEGPDFEFPFFTYLVGGAMTGEVNHASKNAHFNYQTAISETMSQTFARLQKELASKASGEATAFLQQLSSHYPNVFPELLARSLVNLDRPRSGFTTLTILRDLEQSHQPWAAGVSERLEDLPSRRVFTTSEVSHIASQLPPYPEAQVVDQTQLQEDMRQLAGDADIYSFKDKLRNGGNISISMGVDLDTVSGAIDVRLHYSDGTKTRHVPFHLTFDEQNGAMKIETIDQAPLTQDIIDRYKNIVVHAVQVRAEEKRVREATRTNGNIVSKATTERRGNNQQKNRIKTRGTSTETGNTVIPEAEIVGAPSTTRSKIAIENLDFDHIKELLDEKGIEAVSAERILGKLDYHLKVANETGRPPGKPIDLTDAAGRARHAYDIRQINWALDGGNVQIRIYLLGEGDNTHYKLVGIMRKDGESQQREYIRKLVKQIANGRV